MDNKTKVTSNIDIEEYSEKDLSATQKGAYEDENEKHVKIEYNLTPKEVDESLKLFQKKNLYKRNMVYTVCCLIITVISFLDLAFFGQKKTFDCLFIGVSLAIIFIVWYNLKYYRKKVCKAFESEDLNFNMNVYPDYIFIKELEGGVKLRYSNYKTKVYEQTDKFIISVSKERIYIIPKRCIDEKTKKEIINYFKSGLKDRFIVINNKEKE